MSECVAFEYEVLGTEGGQGTLDVRALFAPRRRTKLTAPILPRSGAVFLLRVQSQPFGLQPCDQIRNAIERLLIRYPQRERSQMLNPSVDLDAVAAHEVPHLRED